MSPHAATQERAVSPVVADAAKNVSNLARRIHGWTWQAVRITIHFFILTIYHLYSSLLEWVLGECHAIILIHTVPTSCYPLSAVYVSLSGVKDKNPAVLHVEHVFFFLNIALFLLNSLTLLIQLFLYPRQSLRLIKDPVKGLFVPLIALSFATILIGTINYGQYHKPFRVDPSLTTRQPSRVVSSTPRSSMTSFGSTSPSLSSYASPCS